MLPDLPGPTLTLVFIGSVPDHFEFKHRLSDFTGGELLRSDLAWDHSLIDEQGNDDTSGSIGPRRHDDLNAHYIEGRLWRPWLAHNRRSVHTKSYFCR
jgi:hypothetical protein